MWIKCESLDGNPVWINPAQIAAVRSSDDNTLITFAGGASETVTADIDVFMDWVKHGQIQI